MAKIIEFPCPVCGKNLTASSKEEVTRCVHCGKLLYLSNALDPVGDVNIIVVPANDQINQSEPIVVDQPNHVESANDHKSRRSRLRSDPNLDLKRLISYLYVVVPGAPVMGGRQLLQRMVPSPTAPTKSVVEQIDEILQENISGTPLEKYDIRLLEDPSAGVIVEVDQESFIGVDAVTDPEIKAAIRAAVAQWEAE